MKWQYNDGGRKSAGYKGMARDCVCRAIAIATERPYDDIYNLINYYAAKERSRNGNRSNARQGVFKHTIRRVMAHLGWEWIPTMQIGSGCKVHLADGELPMGRLVVSVSRHETAVIDGVINDTHDCSRDGSRCVYGYYRAGDKAKIAGNPAKTPSNGEQAPTAPSIPPKRNARKTALTARYTREGFLMMSAGRILRQDESMIPMEMRPYYIGGMVEKDYAGPMTADKPFHNFVRSHIHEIAERRTRPQTVVRAYKHGWTIQRAENEEQLRYAYRGIPEGVDKRELQKYLAKNDIDFHDYLHYCDAAERAGWNIRAFGRTFPRDLHAATIEAQETKKRKDEARFLAVSKRINYLLDWMRRKVELRVGAYTFVVPTTEQEFIEEGKAMRNCIGGYYRHQVDGSAFCFFIRKDGKRHADVEMSSRGAIRQCRLFANEAADAETRTVAEQMAKTFAAQMRKAA